MKIVIINENPAVSRLATLALDKIGLEYAQIGNAGELDGPCDVLIVDSDSDAKDMNLKQFVNKISYLSSKNASKIWLARAKRPLARLRPRLKTMKCR